ncbi:MAG: DUF86 domain-containing protein [Bacteroidota bacterium]
MPDKFGDKARLLHVLDAIQAINGYTKELNFEDFSNNSMVCDACLRQLSIIGEATNRISEEITKKFPGISWRQIIGLRNIVIHQYFGVDKQVIWNVIKVNLPDLRVKVEQVLDSL